jgi:dTDP-4-amino-4,6-dideoxygalactose transaminase
MSLTTAIPLFVPDFGAQEERQVLEVLRSGWIAMGPKVEEFERRFASIAGVPHAVALNSATAALHLANVLLDIGPGDEVIVPSLTFAATANAVLFTGATPVFADVEGLDDWTISPSAIARLLTPKTRAIIPMHYAGFPCDMSAIGSLAAAAGVHVIEDACHGLGGTVDGAAMGALGAISCFSFYSNKVMTTGEGGMLVTADAARAARARQLRSHGMSATSIDRMRGAMGYDIHELGWNYRLDDLRAAVGVAQLDRLPHALARRRLLVERYRRNLASVAGVHFPQHGRRGVPADYLVPILIERGDRDAVRRIMAELGVQTSLHYPPVHTFALYRDTAAPLPHTEEIAARTLTLPLYPSLTEAQVDQVCDALSTALRRGA